MSRPGVNRESAGGHRREMRRVIAALGAGATESPSVIM
jgi:hypothetical protein